MTFRSVCVAVLCLIPAALASAERPPGLVAPSSSARELPTRPEQGEPARDGRPQAITATFLVLPFENSSRLVKLDWLGEGLAELTLERLAGEGRIVFPREEWLAAVEKLGVPASTRFSRATMLKIAEEADADYVVFGQYASDGNTLTVTARVLGVNPPGLLAPVTESGALENLMDIHARLTWRILRSVEPAYPLSERDFARRFPRLRLDAFEYYVRGLLNSESKRDEQRLRLLREAARLEPAWDDAAFALGQTYFARRDCDSALLWLTRIPPAHERGLEASFAAGVCYLLRNDPARAEAAFAGLLERVRPGVAARELPEALNNLAVARGRLGKSREAVAGFERATQLDPEEVDYWFNLGLAALRASEAAAAAQAFREVLRRQPADAEARALLIGALEGSGRATEAAAERDELARAGARGTPLPSLAPEALGRLERIKTRLDAASAHPLFGASAGAAAAGATSAARSQHRQLHLRRGRQLLAAGKLDEAQREFTAAIVLAPLSAPAHQGLAEVYRRQGRPDDAIRELRAALASRDDAAARTTLARLYLEQNRPAEAREELRLALRLDPGYAEARHLLEQLEARRDPGGSR